MTLGTSACLTIQGEVSEGGEKGGEGWRVCGGGGEGGGGVVL